MELVVSLALSKGLLQADLRLRCKKAPSLRDSELWKRGREAPQVPLLAAPSAHGAVSPHLPIRAPGCSLFFQALRLMEEVPLIQDK